MATALLFLSALVSAGFCAFLAGEKNRSAIGWFFLGLFFNLIALVALVGAPVRQTPFPK